MQSPESVPCPAQPGSVRWPYSHLPGCRRPAAGTQGAGAVSPVHGRDSATDRVVLGEYNEDRGISANTTQNQCAKFRIQDDETIEKGATSCYASTTVRVVGNSGEILNLLLCVI